MAVPEIADYEVRRELLRLRANAALRRLDLLGERLVYVPLTTAAIRRAAELWAQMRQQGQPTADPHALDADVILAAQAQLAAGPDDLLTIATTNVGHLGRLVQAQRWDEIRIIAFSLLLLSLISAGSCRSRRHAPTPAAMAMWCRGESTCPHRMDPFQIGVNAPPNKREGLTNPY